MKLEDSLNPEQLEAVLHSEGPLLILAGAGSGKTRVITCRIAHLIEERGVEPWQILAVTFTNKAAGEMRERVAGLVEEAKGLWISTFHAFGARVLRKHAELLGWEQDFVIYDADDSKRLGKTVLKELDLDPELNPVEKMLRHVEKQKHRLQVPKDSGKGERAAFYVRYQRKLRQANAFDFADLILQPWRLLSEFPEVLDEYRARFEHVMVDEFQDTDRAQYAVLKLICPEEANLCVVGDDDQSIYMWRDADVSNILGFRKDYPTAKTVKLERNYRSTQSILEAAASVIAKNKRRHEKTLWTEISGGEPVGLELLEDEREEADYVAREIYYAREGGDSLRDMAVFYRMNAQSRALEEAFRLYGLPYVVVGGTRFFDRMEVRDLVAYLRLLMNPRSDLDVLRVINVPGRGIGNKTKDRLSAIAEDQGAAIFEVLTEENVAGLRKDAREKVLGFRGLIDDLRTRMEGMGADGIIEMVMERTGYFKALEKEGSETSLSRRENLRELVTAAMEFGSMSGDSTLQGFLEHVALVTDIDMAPKGTAKNAAEGGAEAVSLMTLHAAKGLEFEWVFMTGMEEGMLPHYRSMRPDEDGTFDSGGPEEERRLCYVGMTRARRRLLLTCVKRRVIFGRGERNPPSRFLGEMGGGGGADTRTPHCESGAAGTPRRTRTRGWDTCADVVDMMDVDLDEGDGIVVDYSDDYSQVPGGERPGWAGDWVGTEVEHATFGMGRVIDAQETRRGTKLVIEFEAVGRKTVYANYVKPV